MAGVWLFPDLFGTDCAFLGRVGNDAELGHD